LARTADIDTRVRPQPLAARLVASLALALIPLGIVAAMLTVSYCNTILGDKAITPEAVAALTRVQMTGIAFPLLMWATALGIGALAMRRHVVVPLTRLQALVEASGRGDTMPGDPASDAGFSSVEMRAMAASVIRMASDVETQSRDLGTALAEQQRLTREVHHRVKNSLQIISSLLSLHARGQSTPEIAQAYAAMQARVGALTMVHRWIYDQDGVDIVNLHALLADLAIALQASLVSPRHPHPTIAIGDVEAMSIGASAAIPVAFLITELASMALQNARGRALQIAIAALRSDKQVSVSVTAAAFAGADLVTGDGPSGRIVLGMARQLRGNVRHDAVAGRYTVSFSDG
jgi:two-component sensor histidine kinase